MKLVPFKHTLRLAEGLLFCLYFLPSAVRKHPQGIANGLAFF